MPALLSLLDLSSRPGTEMSDLEKCLDVMSKVPRTNDLLHK